MLLESMNCMHVHLSATSNSDAKGITKLNMPVFLGYAPSDDPADNCCSVSLSPRLDSLVYCEASCRLDLTPVSAGRVQ